MTLETQNELLMLLAYCGWGNKSVTRSEGEPNTSGHFSSWQRHAASKHRDEEHKEEKEGEK